MRFPFLQSSTTRVVDGSPTVPTLLKMRYIMRTEDEYNDDEYLAYEND